MPAMRNNGNGMSGSTVSLGGRAESGPVLHRVEHVQQHREWQHGVLAYSGTLQRAPAWQTVTVQHSKPDIPWATKQAARAAIFKAATLRSEPPHDLEAEETELDDVLEQLRASGRIGHPVHTPAASHKTLRDLPELKLSQKLAQASQLAAQEHKNGHQLSGGVHRQHGLKHGAASSTQRALGSSKLYSNHKGADGQQKWHFEHA